MSLDEGRSTIVRCNGWEDTGWLVKEVDFEALGRLPDSMMARAAVVFAVATARPKLGF